MKNYLIEYYNTDTVEVRKDCYIFTDVNKFVYSTDNESNINNISKNNFDCIEDMMYHVNGISITVFSCKEVV